MEWCGAPTPKGSGRSILPVSASHGSLGAVCEELPVEGGVEDGLAVDSEEVVEGVPGVRPVGVRERPQEGDRPQPKPQSLGVDRVEDPVQKALWVPENCREFE